MQPFLSFIFELFENFSHTLFDVFKALLPMLVFFLIFQFFFLKLPKKRVLKVLKGMFLSYWGLCFFLQGVHVGFFPAGDMLGKNIIQNTQPWVLIPVGFIMGFMATLAEPAIRVLIDEVEKVTGGHLKRNILRITLCVGVAFSVALAMLKLTFGISLWYFLVPGYLLALLITRFVRSDFVAIAFDSGGVATGPMIVTFVMSISVGASSVMPNRNPLFDGFGLVALVALTPILAVLTLGYLYERKEKKYAHPAV